MIDWFMYGTNQKVTAMGKVISMAEYRQKRKAKYISKILDIQAEQLCWSQQSTPRGRKSIADEYRRKYKWTDLMRDSTDEI